MSLTLVQTGKEEMLGRETDVSEVDLNKCPHDTQIIPHLWFHFQRVQLPVVNHSTDAADLPWDRWTEGQ